MTVFFTSDLHLGHANILRIANRPFASVGAMNEQLVKNINQRVGQGDTLWILGDLSYRMPPEEAEVLIQQIQCSDVRLVRGNHDPDWEGSGLFQEICDYKELKLDGRRVCLMHYPIASWNGMHHGAVHLHGHSHNPPAYNLENVMNERLLWDVGVDANAFAPVSWEEIRDGLLI